MAYSRCYVPLQMKRIPLQFAMRGTKNYCAKTEINREIKRENVKQVSESITILWLIKFFLNLLFAFARLFCC